MTVFSFFKQLFGLGEWEVTSIKDYYEAKINFKLIPAIPTNDNANQVIDRALASLFFLCKALMRYYQKKILLALSK